jgi:LuxR family transcriptional regulator, maltose regulon positive regulatory protein
VTVRDAFKTVVPEIVGVIERPGLVARLHASGAPAKWLSAPSGSGKSTLAASYARDTGKEVVWYRLDARDDDPAFFYPSFSAALGDGTLDLAALPRFSTDDHGDERAFAERFFAAIGSAFPIPRIVVLDDAHKIQREARHDALARLAMQADTTLEVMFVSEEPAPPPFFDAVAARQLSLCNDLSLAFDAEECRALGDALRLAGADGANLAALTGGHAGALVLACEFLRGAGSDGGRADAAIERIHLHLLGKLLEQMPAPRSDLLLRTAFAPHFTSALAAELAGADESDEIDSLVERGLLRQVATASGQAYEAHGLIQRGMRSLLRERLGEVQTQELALNTAEQLLKHGYDEDAFSLLIERNAHTRAAEVLEALAPRYARASQAALLSHGLTQLPAALVNTKPWLCFWAGRALLGIDEEVARGWFERSYAMFETSGDAAGMRVAAASVVTAFVLEYGDIRTFDLWLDRHLRAGGGQAVEPGCDYESTLCVGVMAAAINAAAYPAGFDADALVRRLQVLADDESAWLTSDQSIEAARLLIDQARIFGNHEQAQNIVLATRSLAERPTASPLQRGRWLLSAACAYFEDVKPDSAAEFLRQARSLVASTGSRRLAFEFGMISVDAELKRGDLGAAWDHLNGIESVAAAAPPAQRAEYARLTARVLLAQKKIHEGLRWATEAMQTAALAGYTGANLRAFQHECICGLAANGRIREAVQLAQEMTAGLEGTQLKSGMAIDCCLQFLAGDGAELSLLERGLQHAADVSFIHLLARGGDCLTDICDAALSNNLQPEFVRRMIVANRLEPPEHAGPHWPWSVRIRTLGGFELEIQGERYRPAHKVQDKPLELLKLLVCGQAMGRDSVDKQWITDRLWPDADAPNARKSLDMTISRLRRLLRDDDAVLSLEGRLQLAPRRVWTDVAPLLRALSLVGMHRDDHAGGRKVRLATATADVRTVLEHFRGPFLPEDEGPPWLLAGREAVVAAVRSALLTADTLLAGREDEFLIPALERAFVADTTSEDIARALMRALARRDQFGEALRVYRRLREMLSIVLGLVPSRETEQLREKIYAEAHAGSASSTTVLRS